jgi:hypothetical protein
MRYKRQFQMLMADNSRLYTKRWINQAFSMLGFRQFQTKARNQTGKHTHALQAKLSADPSAAPLSKSTSTFCLCRYNEMLERVVAGFFVKTIGMAIKHGLTRPPVDVSDMDQSAGAGYWIGDVVVCAHLSRAQPGYGVIW